MPLEQLPLLNALLNSASTVCILAGWACIAREMKRAHALFMAAAVVFSAIFLASYLYYHFHAGSVRFTAGGWARPVYFTILVSHIALAFAVPPLVLATVFHALRGRFDRHRRLARWTLPVWLYVSATGVLIYLMLYVWFPARPAAGAIL